MCLSTATVGSASLVLSSLARLCWGCCLTSSAGSRSYLLLSVVIYSTAAPSVPLQCERERHAWGVNLVVQSAFLFSFVLPFACEDVLVSRTCFSLCSAMIPEDGGWGSQLARA